MSTKKSEERCDIVRLEAMSRLDNLFLAGPGPNWYKVFLSDVVIPNPRLFAWLDVAAELSVGVG